MHVDVVFPEFLISKNDVIFCLSQQSIDRTVLRGEGGGGSHLKICYGISLENNKSKNFKRHPGYVWWPYRLHPPGHAAGSHPPCPLPPGRSPQLHHGLLIRGPRLSDGAHPGCRQVPGMRGGCQSTLPVPPPKAASPPPSPKPPPRDKFISPSGRVTVCAPAASGQGRGQ